MVEADKLTENFANILSAPIIATNVTMKVLVHKGLEFRNEEEENLHQLKTYLPKNLVVLLQNQLWLLNTK